MKVPDLSSIPGKPYLKASLAILIVFSVGLVGFFIFSADLGDGLERTIEEGEGEESSEYEGPLDYGDDYPAAFISGLVGFIVVFVVVVGYSRIRVKIDET